MAAKRVCVRKSARRTPFPLPLELVGVVMTHIDDPTDVYRMACTCTFAAAHANDDRFALAWAANGGASPERVVAHAAALHMSPAALVRASARNALLAVTIGLARAIRYDRRIALAANDKSCRRPRAAFAMHVEHEFQKHIDDYPMSNSLTIFLGTVCIEAARRGDAATLRALVDANVNIVSNLYDKSDTGMSGLYAALLYEHAPIDAGVLAIVRSETIRHAHNLPAVVWRVASFAVIANDGDALEWAMRAARPLLGHESGVKELSSALEKTVERRGGFSWNVVREGLRLHHFTAVRRFVQLALRLAPGNCVVRCRNILRRAAAKLATDDEVQKFVGALILL